MMLDVMMYVKLIHTKHVLSPFLYQGSSALLYAHTYHVCAINYVARSYIVTYRNIVATRVTRREHNNWCSLSGVQSLPPLVEKFY